MKSEDKVPPSGMDIINKNAPAYRSSRRKSKILMLRDIIEATGYSRKHLAMLLRNAGKVVFTPYGVRVVADPDVSFMSKHRPSVVWIFMSWVQ